MPKNKDVKKVVGAGMTKTEESYGIAKLRPRTRKGRAAMAQLSASPDAPATPAIYEVKVTLSEITPAIWRRLLVPAEISLAELHHVIQAAFGWLDYHLHQYIVDEQYFGDPNSEFADELPPITDECDATLRDIVDAKEIVYEYDFGDSWRHVIQIENLAIMAEPGVKYPVCTAGARSRPPEDCGGTSGYDELLEVLADPKHEEHASMKRWVGKKFAPERFDLAAVNRALQKIRSGTPQRSRVGGSRIPILH